MQLQERMAKRRLDKQMGVVQAAQADLDRPSEADEILGSVVKQVFDEADSNKDGGLTPLELRAFVAREGLAEPLAAQTHVSRFSHMLT